MENPELTNKLYQSLKIICYTYDDMRTIADSCEAARTKYLKSRVNDKLDKITLRKMREIKGD